MAAQPECLGSGEGSPKAVRRRKTTCRLHVMLVLSPADRPAELHFPLTRTHGRRSQSSSESPAPTSRVRCFLVHGQRQLVASRALA